MDLTKFSNLPGIDTYNADVYESSEMPEADQADMMFKPGTQWKENIRVVIICYCAREEYLNGFKSKL